MLTDEQKKQLDAQIKKMSENGATEDEIKKYADDFKKRYGKNTITFSDWAKCLEPLTGMSKVKDKDVYRRTFVNGDKLFFSKGGKLQYFYKNGTKEDGTWECNGENGYLAELSNGQKWDGSKWNKNKNSSGGSNTGGGEYQPLESGAYTWKGDPYQYKVVNGQWHTKSWKNRGEIIQNWTSLANNQTATSRLDKRHPGVRVGKQGNEKSAEYAKKFGQELERAKSLMDKKIEYTPSDYRKFLTNPATNTADSTATSAKPTVDIKPVEPEISGPVRTINPADPF